MSISGIKLNYNGLSKYTQKKMASINNLLYASTPVNLKMTLQEQQKVLDPTLSGKNYIIENIVQIKNTNIKLIDSFTNECQVDFYTDILDTIDNMILLEFIKTRILFDKNELYDYSVTQTVDVNLDILLAYYVIKFPEDTSVDENKLKALKLELHELLDDVHC
jgi:hypothetical protein